MAIRRATIDDLMAVRDEQRAFWGDHDITAIHHPLLVHDFGETAFVLRDGGEQVLAYLLGMLTPRRVGYCHLIAVREGHRGNGYARALYERFEEAARARGAIALKAMTRPVNRGSIGFHSSIGFTAREVPDYVGAGETRVVFEKALSAGPAPPPRTLLPSGAELRPVQLSDAEALHSAVEANRAHLARYLPWADEELERTLVFVERSLALMQAGEALRLVILRDGRPVGMADLNEISRENRTAAIGYWLVESEQGRGTMTQAVRTLLEEAFERREVERVVIRAAAENVRSRAIPERLGFTAEATLRRAHRVAGRAHDEVIYALLSGDRQSGMSN